MKYKLIGIIFVMILLASVMVSAKYVSKGDELNWDIKKLTVKEDGVYDEVGLIKEASKSQVWIDKKIGDVYHVDSLVDDVEVYLELFYDIQPDYIDYVSHNGKYEERYTYNDWGWRDKVCEKDIEYCGGYVTLDVILERGTGSNTFTDAITGATWANDGIDITLTETTDYTVSGAVFTIVDHDLDFTGITTSYSYSTDRVDVQDYALAKDAEEALGEYGNWFKILVIVGIAGVILYLIISQLALPQEQVQESY